MRTLLLLLLINFNTSIVFSQETPSKKIPPQKQVIPTKNEIQSQMNGAVNVIIKQISDLKNDLKNVTDPEEKKSLEEKISLLEKQVSMMQGLNKNISALSSTAIQKGLEDESESAVVKKDIARINLLPKKILSNAELPVFLKNVQLGVEKIIPVAEKTEALNIYNETKSKYRSTAVVANAANGCWMLGHWEKALVIMGKACIDDMNDADNLNNYAAFLIMTGGEQAALPILEYLNEKYPDNSTILNNIGQAWFGLGDMEKAQKYLIAVTELYPNHSMANSTLSKVALSSPAPNKTKSIAFLKASLKEMYDPEKEGELRKLGYEVTFDDMPPFNYPMKDDPFNFIPLINSWPEKLQSSINDVQPAIALQRYLRGINSFYQQLQTQDAELDKKIQERSKKIATNSDHSQDFIQSFNCPAYLQAARSLELINFESSGSYSQLITQLLFPYKPPFRVGNRPLTVAEVYGACKKIWTDSVVAPVAALSKAMLRYPTTLENCEEVDEMINKFLEKRNEIYNRGLKLIKKEFIKRSRGYNDWIKLNLYAAMDGDPDYLNLRNAMIDDLTYMVARDRFENSQLEVFLAFIETAEDFKTIMKGRCHPTPDGEENSTDQDEIAPLKVKSLDCEYEKKVKPSGQYEFKLECNKITENIDAKLGKRKPNVHKGSSNVANRNNSTKGPMQGPKGPNVVLNEIDQAEAYNQKGPLTSEHKDISQFSLEYNKSGNLVGFNFQLNEDGTQLKDPDSVESGIDSRWSWNAIASTKKGYMNRLLMK